MQIFLPYKSPLQVAKCLDNRRLHKQIVECNQIIKAIQGISEAWKNHPICKMYKDNLNFVILYKTILEEYKCKVDEQELEILSKKAIENIPSFITQEYLDVMKKRLYTKDKEHYCQFSNLGECDYNLYFVENKWKKYINGKVVNII